MKGNNSEYGFKIKHFVYFFTVIIILLILFTIYFIAERRNIERQEFDDLKSVSEVKKEQMVGWMKERIADGEYLKTSESVKNFLKNTGDEDALSRLKKKLDVFSIDKSYTNIRIFNSAREHLYSSRVDVIEISKSISEKINTAISEDSVILSDFFFCEFHKKIHLDLIVPVTEGGKVLGIILIDIDPRLYLYPMIQKYTLKDKTSEVLLVRREGDSVLFLNELRYRHNSAMKLKISLEEKNIPAVRAVLDETGCVTGADYAGKKVFAYISSVPISDWHMVAKKDASEVYSSISSKLLTALLFMLFILALVSAVIFFLWYRERTRHLLKDLENQRSIQEKNRELQDAVYQLESANEELQASEEELIAAEEELRTQVEELETSQRSLLESEEKFRVALKNANITVFTNNNRLEYTWIYNPPAGIISSEILGKTDYDILEKMQARKVSEIKERVLKSGIAEESNLELIFGSKKRYFTFNVEPIYDKNRKITGVLCAAMDITERKAMEEELFQAYKMEAVGQLAGGVAHDFNNMLAGIMGSAEMLQYKLAGDETLLVYVFNILRASEHAARLTSQLLSFARKGQYQKIPVSTHRIIIDVVNMLENTIDKRIRIEQKLNANPNTVLGDPTQIQNAILNLAINARDSYCSEGGVIVIATEKAELSKEYTEKYRKDINAGDYVLIKVIDRGCGMSEEVKKHLFEPFFTTKETGKGTGLGLASVYGIVKNHNGIIEVESEPGKGTEIKVYLPVSSSEPVEREEVYPLGSFNGLGMTILIVDDEDLIRKNTEEVLLKYGYRVLHAKNGREAIEVLKRNSEEINLVILDMIMPDMDGRETFIQMKKVKFEVNVLLSTGYSADEEANKMVELGIKGFIQKPFKATELLKKLHEILTKS
ncbi:MAG: response regulator [bacterium]|nr:response regulator [bacterium]